MMNNKNKNHIYVNTDILNVKYLNKDEMLKPICVNDYEMYEKLCKNEFGIIETGESIFHFIVGPVKNNGCPWCGLEPNLVMDVRLSCEREMYIYCPQCGSRGPLLKVPFEHEKEVPLDYRAILAEIYSNQMPWYKFFKNPYVRERTAPRDVSFPS